MPAASRVEDGIGCQVEPAAFDGSGLCFRSAIHLHGSTPHRKSGVVLGQRAGLAHGGAHRGQARPCAEPFTMEWQVLEGMTWTCASASSTGTTSALIATRFRSAQRRPLAGRSHSLYERLPQGRHLKGDGRSDSRIGTSGAGNDCDAFRSVRSWPSGGPTEDAS